MSHKRIILIYVAVVLSAFATSQTNVASTQLSKLLEGYFNSNDYVRLPHLPSLRTQIGLSFRTCSYGKLFSQDGAPDSVRLDVQQDGSLLLVVKVQGQEYETSTGHMLIDNRWHNVDLEFLQGELSLTVDEQKAVVANKSFRPFILNANVTSENAYLEVGYGFTGCILEGPSVLFSSVAAEYANVVRATCPMPYAPDCREIEGTECDSNLYCHGHGACKWTASTTECYCYDRYSGLDCATDAGPLCERQDAAPQCVNGVCREDDKGNATCQCDDEYTGELCDIYIQNTGCRTTQCENNGTCIAARDGSLKCKCLPGYAGDRCEISDFCLTNPCKNGGTCRMSPTGTGFVCDCSPWFDGDMCEKLIDKCLENPCHRGDCYRRYGTYKCECPTTYGGKNCDQCMCLNNGSCDQSIDYCECAPGYQGTHCEDVVSMAILGCREDNSVCSNDLVCRDGQCVCPWGGVPPKCDPRHVTCDGEPLQCIAKTKCVEGTSDLVCDCNNEFHSRQCEPNVDNCDPYPRCIHAKYCLTTNGSLDCVCEQDRSEQRCAAACNNMECLNDGICISYANGSYCHCKSGYSGQHCEIIASANPCADNACGNGGTCHATNATHYYCECQKGYEGYHCESNQNDCIGVVCDSGKECVDRLNGYECRCPSGYGGENCTNDIDECTSNPCKHGLCKNYRNSYTCECNGGWEGVNCDQDINECNGTNPCNNGLCQNNEGGFECFCRPGFSGTLCQSEVDECLSLPCKNNAECVNEVNKYSCVCPKEYTGDNCENDVDECAENPPRCQNNGTCENFFGNYTCTCVPGFTGRDCEVNINDCEVFPCLNGGKCIDGVNEFSCDCRDTGYEGKLCENVNHCSSSPCENGATCRNDELREGYTCFCTVEYTGEHCESAIRKCKNEPCQHGGTCIDTNSTTADGIEEPGYICTCLEGFTGTDCEVNIDDCASVSCYNNGTCQDKINDYECHCLNGYEGRYCEVNIDDCANQPCQEGSTCVDGVASYTCQCQPGYGGRNCNVELTVCNGGQSTCLNGATCVPYVVYVDDKPEQRSNCTCHSGYTGPLCETATTVSMSGVSLITVTSTQEDGYELEFRFRTTNPSGVIALGHGMTYFRIALVDGYLSITSSLLNKWGGIKTDNKVNDGNWQYVNFTLKDTQMVMFVNDNAYDSHTSAAAINNSNTGFPTTYFGGYATNVASLADGIGFYVGCMEDIKVNGQVVSSQNVNAVKQQFVELGCPRTEQCSPTAYPCQNGGICTDLWRNFSCQCLQPFVGLFCQYEYKAATFNHENITKVDKTSYVSVDIDNQIWAANSSSYDISMFIRTRKPDGLIFYMSNHNDSDSFWQNSTSYFAGWLKDGYLHVEAHMNNTAGEISVANVTVNSITLNDGTPYLVKAFVYNNVFQVLINGTERTKRSRLVFSTFEARHLYLGGLPISRMKRQITGVNETKANPRISPFKGVLQDVRVNVSNKVYSVEMYELPKSAPNVTVLPHLGEVHRVNVYEDSVPDDSCAKNPCKNDGVCVDVWNDFFCNCTPEYKGKTCTENEFCSWVKCPHGSACNSLENGFECVANATFENTKLMYTINASTPVKTDNISFQFRSQNEGVILFAHGNSASGFDGNNLSADTTEHPSPVDNMITIRVNNQSVLFEWNILQGQTPMKGKLAINSTSLLDGNWHTVTITIKNGIQGFIDMERRAHGEISNSVVEAITSLLHQSDVYLGGLENDRNGSFRGCMSNVRIGGVLLSFVSYDELDPNNYGSKELEVKNFAVLDVKSNTDTMLGCIVCRETDCQHDSTCKDAAESFDCDCKLGFEGQYCEINIDECRKGHNCSAGSTCVDGINNYTCSCANGYEGRYCDVETNECLSNPCGSNGVCQDEINNFVCTCNEEYIGRQCEKKKTCRDNPCANGTCRSSGDGFKCDCTFGYEGLICALYTDFCKGNPCQNGGTCTNMQLQGYTCNCQSGFTGTNCSTNIDDCVNNDCEHNGVCVDGIGSFTCNCNTTGYTGEKCTEDIDECLLEDNCKNGNCTNTEGSYICDCYDGFCGQQCKQRDPCNENSGDGLSIAVIVVPIVATILIIGAVGLTLFLMMARKKRATRGTYSPSRQEYCNPRLELDNVLKPPPEERLI